MKNNKHAFVLENISDKKIFVVFAENPNKELGEKLVKLLHGKNIVNTAPKSRMLSKKTKNILDRAKKLVESNTPWHHHMLFPQCIFNKHKGKWNLILEIPTESKVIENISEKEPIKELQAIENMYYKNN